MVKEITKREIIKLVKNDLKNLSDQPNLWRVLIYKKMDIDKNNQPIDFDVEVRFQNPNYLSIVRDLYNADIYGNIHEGPCSNHDFSYVSNLKNKIDQLVQDGYIVTRKQEINYHTEYGKKNEYSEDGGQEIYVDAKKLFSKEEQEYLETSIVLTTKGQKKLDFWKEKFFSEPVGFVSLIIAIISLIISFCNK